MMRKKQQKRRHKDGHPISILNFFVGDIKDFGLTLCDLNRSWLSGHGNINSSRHTRSHSHTCDGSGGRSSPRSVLAGTQLSVGSSRRSEGCFGANKGMCRRLDARQRQDCSTDKLHDWIVTIRGAKKKRCRLKRLASARMVDRCHFRRCEMSDRRLLMRKLGFGGGPL
jgi:hypothetical protein